MATKGINSINIEICNGHYGTVEIEVNKERGSVTHKYYSVPKDAIMKLLNAKSEPSIADFEKWKNAATETHENAIVDCEWELGWWDKED
jgi:hypothetical protein